MGIETRARCLDASAVQAAERFGQTAVAPVEAVIVGQAAGVDAGALQASHIGGVHAEVNAFARPRPAGGGDGCFQIRDPQQRAEAG